MDETENVREDDGVGKKRKYKSKNDRMWDLSRNFQIEWVSKYPFIELVDNPIEGEPLVECRCKICSEINKKEKRLQLKIDTIEKHMGKVYEKKTIDGVQKLVIRWKTKEESQHVRNAELYEF